MRFLTVVPRRGDGWLEATLLPAFALILSWLLDPRDPLLLQQPFPWLVIIPLLIALRYEFLPALLSGLVLFSTLAWHPYPVTVILPVAAGTLLVALIAAEFASYWLRREAGRTLQEEITATRLRQLADDLYVTRISLDRLEQSLLYQPVSVRTAIQELRQRLALAEGVMDSDLLRRVLYFFNQLAGVQIAAWYRLEPRGTHPICVAELGKISDWDGSDPVWKAAVSERCSQSLADLGIDRIHHYISVHLHGEAETERFFLCIEEMSFFAINRESLQIVEVLFQYLCNYRDALQVSQPILRRWPDCPAEFATDFQQLQNLARIVPNVGVCIRYDFRSGEAAQNVVHRIQNLRRGMDVLWLHEESNRISLLALLPFVGSSGAEGYRSRIEAEHRKYCADSWEQAFLGFHLFTVDGRNPADQLQKFLTAGGSL